MSTDPAVAIREGYVPGCVGRVTEMHAQFYARHAGFGLYFESKVARELAEFCERYVEGRDGLWLAIAGGRIEGSMAVDGIHVESEGAHLRWFITSDEVRGRGVGRRLLAAALEHCSARGYRRVYLWTFEGLDAARHLYEKHGFRLSQQRRGRQWGAEVNEQCFAREQP